MPYSHAVALPASGRKRGRPASAAANVSAVRSAASSASWVRRQKNPSSESTCAQKSANDPTSWLASNSSSLGADVSMH
jgi:hypothetical protein